jgi:monoamine oxidase
MTQPVSRRTFLQMVGALGGSAATYQVALGLGLIPVMEQVAAPELAPLPKGRSRKVLILGAGLSGLTAAYELSRKGYEVQVLEASRRAGGRNLTLRSGDRIEEVGNPQLCRFDADPDLYFNAGPARIPGHHSALLGYCKELGVALSPFINDNRNAWVHDATMFQGRRVRNRQYIADSRGFVAELMAKSADPKRFNAALTKGDWQRLLDYLKGYGDLDPKLRYLGSNRGGSKLHDLTRPEQFQQPLQGRDLLSSRLVRMLTFVEDQNQSAMLMEPVGGMDRIVAGFMKRVGQLVRTDAPVTAIRLEERGVQVVYRHAGKSVAVRGDFCLNCIPLHLLSRIENNFPSDYAAGCAAIEQSKYFKIGLQMKERFWERDGIYGGISWTTQDITQLWYPAHGIHRSKGIVLSAYTFNAEIAERFAQLSPQARIEEAIRQAEKLHPDYGKYVENGVSIPWQRIAHMMGAGAYWTDKTRARWFKRLQAPVGRHYLMGDQISYHDGWQESAIQSAFRALADIDRRVREAGSNMAAA